MGTCRMSLLVVFLCLSVLGFGQICPVMTNTELITNGDFSLGPSGFTSDYTIYSGAPPLYSGNGGYVWTNPNQINSGYFANMGDHTTGTGSMFIIDVDGTLGKDVYRTDVTVMANTTYFFSAWFANINLSTGCPNCNNPGYTPPSGCAVPSDCSPANTKYENTPVLKFSINGSQVGSLLKADSTDHLWKQFFYVWNSGSASGTITLRIENMETSPFGNDLAIDDVSFSTGCSNIHNLNSLGQSSVLADTIKTCTVNFPLTLDPVLPASYNFSWRNAVGTLLAAPANNPTYLVPSLPPDGTKYYLCYEYINGCPRIDSVIFKAGALSIELGANKVMCAPVNIPLNSGVSSPPIAVQWFKNGNPVASTVNYTATDYGNYSVTLSSATCGNASDNITISSPSSTISGTGLYCTSSNTAQFTATGSSLIKWYNVASGGSPLNPFDSNPVISTTYTSTNTSTAGCSSGLFAEDISSFPGAVMTTPPCGTNNSNGVVDLMIEVNQVLTLTSFDFYHNSGWGSTGSFNFTLLTNNPSGGPWCGGCSPPGNKDGAGSVLYTESSPNYTVGGSSTIRTFTLTTPQVLNPGKYWLRLQAVGTALGVFDGCSPAVSSTGIWSTPYVDNTGYNVLRIEKAAYNGNVMSTGGLFNLKFQVGVFNTCQRIFVCASDGCVLPVELLDFSGQRATDCTLLSWKVINENNCAFYRLERSTNGISFSTVANVNAVNSPTSYHSYSYKDCPESNTGIFYYRLYQIDKDGNSHLLKLIKVDQKTADLTKLFPNPVMRGNNVFIHLESANEAIVIEIIDVIGKSLVKWDIAPTSVFEFSTSSFAPGIYCVRVSNKVTDTIILVVE